MSGLSVSLGMPSAELGRFASVAQSYGDLARALPLQAEVAKAQGDTLLAAALGKRGEVEAARERVSALRSLLGQYAEPEPLGLTPMPALEMPRAPVRAAERFSPLAALAASLGGAGVLAQYLQGVQAGTDAEYQRSLEEWKSLVREAAVRNEQAMRLWDETQRINAQNAEQKAKWTLGRLGMMREIADAEGDVSEKGAAARAALSVANAQAHELELKGLLEAESRKAAFSQALMESALKQQGQEALERIRGEEARKTEAMRTQGRVTVEGVRTKGRVAVEELRNKGRMAVQKARDYAANLRARWANAARLEAAGIRAKAAATAAEIRQRGVEGQVPKESPEERRMRLKDETRTEETYYGNLQDELKALSQYKRMPDDWLRENYAGKTRAALEREIAGIKADMDDIAASIKLKREALRKKMYSPVVADPFSAGLSVRPRSPQK